MLLEFGFWAYASTKVPVIFQIRKFVFCCCFNSIWFSSSHSSHRLFYNKKQKHAEIRFRRKKCFSLSLYIFVRNNTKKTFNCQWSVNLHYPSNPGLIVTFSRSTCYFPRPASNFLQRSHSGTKYWFQHLSTRFVQQSNKFFSSSGDQILY